MASFWHELRRKHELVEQLNEEFTPEIETAIRHMIAARLSILGQVFNDEEYQVLKDYLNDFMVELDMRHEWGESDG